MNLPTQAPPVPRGFHAASAALPGVHASAGTCNCSGAPAGCKTDRDDCGSGFYAQCNYSLYGCGCECRPVT